VGKRLPYTPSSTIRTALRRLWLRSRERSAALRREGYCCQACGVKQSKAKGREVAVEVHHTAGAICWAEIEAAIRMWLLTDPEDLEVLCLKCHDKRHPR
jgi:predicted HNH restriction endonuclease